MVILSTNATQSNDLKTKVVPDFRRGENIRCRREIYPPTPPLKLQHFCTYIISKNRHMKYNIFCLKSQ